MRSSTKIAAASALALLLCAGAAGGEASTGKSGTWAERVQIVYQAGMKSVVRRNIRVWDEAPERNLDFVWEPATGQPGDGIDADGTVSGKGKLVWRVRGSASYDPATVYSTYIGELRDGRPNGAGRLEIRSGEVFDGQFKDGRLDGKGVHIDAAGNRHEGMFLRGQPEGAGVYSARTGEIFAGSFVAGQRHGKGTTRLAGGTSYASEWLMGEEVSTRPDAIADASKGGLLKIQSGSDAAGKVEIGVVVDQRMTQQSDMQYTHLVRDEDIAIYPTSQEMNDFWNGTGELTTNAYVFDGIDWAEAPAFVEVDVGTTDGSRVKLDSLELQVAGSDAYRKPMLTLNDHIGCVGFRPDFTIKNHGWGDVKDLKMSIQFTGEEAGGQTTRTFTRDVGTFADGIDVAIQGVLDEAGVNTAKLASERFNCQSRDSLNVCRSQVFNNVGFGEVADYVYGEDKLFTTATGKFDYSWSDDYGNTYQASEPFRVNIALATIELPDEMAECGDGFGGAPEALRYQDVKFRIGQRDYAIDMPVRGNRNIKSYTARLKMSAEISSFHQFRVSAKFADGSVRDSKPVSLFYILPRIPNFTPAEPAACYLPPSSSGC